MKNSTRPSPTTRSWRQIRQNASRKVVTAHARRRILRATFKGVLLAVALAAGGGGIYYGLQHWRQGVEKVNTALPAQPLREIAFATDGVLSKEWLVRVLDLAEGMDMMAIDIHRKKKELEAHGQVRKAILRRQPDRLVIDLQERSPAVRLAIRAEDGGVRDLLVDRDGHIYDGHGYNSHELKSLPYLAGVALRRQGDGFQQLAGIDRVDDLLQVARSQAPHLYRGWKVVDCSESPLIKIRSHEVREVIFGPEGYEEQLHWLDMVLESNRRQMLGMQERVDLSLGNQVVVR